LYFLLDLGITKLTHPDSLVNIRVFITTGIESAFVRVLVHAET
jgi:hypothetical protein